MRIAQVAPLAESVPPSEYGGTERVVHNLTEELVRRGHEVTLFASGDSHTSAHLVPIVERALWRDPYDDNHLPSLLLALGTVFERSEEFDIIHSHLEHLALPFTRLVRTPTIITFHGRLDSLSFQPLFRRYSDANLISISNNQRLPLPYANWIATVYNGIDLTHYTLERRKGDYLVFVGRLSPEKGIETAVEVAKRAKIPLKIAAKVDPEHTDFFRSRLLPLFADPLIEYLGEVNDAKKNILLGGAQAMIFPIRWPEPFGLVMVEALACGTPVVAGRYGSVEEIILHGQTGFVCDSIEEMVLAVQWARDLDRAYCRWDVEKRFSARAMADGYEAAYETVLGGKLAAAA